VAVVVAVAWDQILERVADLLSHGARLLLVIISHALTACLVVLGPVIFDSIRVSPEISEEMGLAHGRTPFSLQAAAFPGRGEKKTKRLRRAASAGPPGALRAFSFSIQCAKGFEDRPAGIQTPT
jgi:hypothetical protein